MSTLTSFVAMPPTAMSSGTQSQMNQMRVQSGVGQAHKYSGSPEGLDLQQDATAAGYPLIPVTATRSSLLIVYVDDPPCYVTYKTYTIKTYDL